MLGSSRPVTQNCGSIMSSKRMRCVALVAAIFVVAASPAAAQDPDPLPAPPLPAPDPAPPAPAPAPARPAPVKKPAARPAPTPTPAQVAPAVAPEIATPPAETQPLRAAPIRAKRPARRKEAAPVVPLRRLPIRDASMPAAGETTLVLAAFGASPRNSGDGVNPIALAATVLLSLALALMALAYFAPFVVDQQRFGPFLVDRRNQFLRVGGNMFAAAVVCYLVVATS